jgi:glutathione peroxidase-family protein
MAEDSIYSFELYDGTNNLVDFSQFQNKVLLIVNVASLCGFTPQYNELQYLYNKYKTQGLVVIGIPCNQFGNQEPNDEKGIVQFCRTTYGVDFLIMKKVEVNGDHAAPIYTWLKSKCSGAIGFRGVRWNFEKFLISRNGDVVRRYLTTESPLGFERDIVQLLEEI